MRVAVVAVVAAVAVALPATDFAHASLEHTGPSFRQRLEAAPRTAWLKFDQGVKPLPNSIVVYTARGVVVSGAARSAPDRRKVVVPLHRLAWGAYTVRWHVISGDGHVISGVYTFGVRAAAPPPTEAYGASGPTTSEHVVRWLYFVALALLLGGIGFRVLVVRSPLPPRAEKRFYAVTGIGAVATLHVGILAFILRAEDAL